MPIHTDHVPDVTVLVGVSPHGRLHDHHPLLPLCGAPKLFTQGAGDRDELRISRAKVYKTMRNYRHTSDPGSRSEEDYYSVFFFTYRAKLLNADWFRRRAFFLNFPSMEGKITRS